MKRGQGETAMPLYEINGKRPVIGANTYVHESAEILGDVVIGEECYIAPGAAIRGDFGPVRIGDRTSIQDNCALHCRVGGSLTVGNEVTVGHAAVLHGCVIKDRTIVGMNSVVSDDTTVGEDCIIAECSMVRGGQQIPDAVVVAGVPAVVKGPLKDAQRFRKDAGTKAYVQLTKMYLESCKKL